MMEILKEQGFPLTALCTALTVSRNAYYVHERNSMAKAKDDDIVLNEMGSIVIDYPRYGYRRIARELKTRKFKVNRKRGLRLMRENNLLVKVKKKFHSTTDSAHGFTIYPNLLKEMKERGEEVTRVNQVWVSDITYIALASGRFIFLAVVLDLYSRKVVGWNLGTNLSTDLVVLALQMAREKRHPPAGLIHHSDRGAQYASEIYTNILKANEFQISMSRKGNPYDNAVCESFMKTFKWEEVDLNEYDSYDEAKLRIENFIENIYNQKRLHSSLNYRSPEQFETELLNLQITVPI